MKLIVFLTVGVSLQTAAAFCPRSNYRRLTYEDAKLLAAWTPNNPEPIWEFSGQYQGDMVLTTAQRNGVRDKNLRWPNRIMPYEFDPELDKKKQQEAIKILEDAFRRSCFKPRLRRNNEENYVLVTGMRGKGCWSAVGRRGGCQELNLDPGRCFKYGTVVHEFLHAAGFRHQQCDSNRDDYVDIFQENIRTGKYNNFRKYSSNVVDNFGQSYDYDSVMHYGKLAFSKNKKATILPKNPFVRIGQRDAMSETDLIKLNIMYGCS